MGPSFYAVYSELAPIAQLPSSDPAFTSMPALTRVVFSHPSPPSFPRFSIHAQQRDPGELAAARDSLPQLVQGCENVFHCGFHAENSYGATPYLIRRPKQPARAPAGPSSAFQPGSSGGSSSGSASGGAQQLSQAGSGGNILVDVPRWSPALAKRIEQLGGIRWIFLTHEDDVGDHEAWARHFGAERIIHHLEANSRQGTE